MPYASKKQQAFLHSQHPEVARKFDKETSKEQFKHLPERAHEDHKGKSHHSAKGEIDSDKVKSDLEAHHKRESSKNGY